jgi:hypothetical protein
VLAIMVKLLYGHEVLMRIYRRQPVITAACGCYDPVVFGHRMPCSQWETEPWEGSWA